MEKQSSVVAGVPPAENNGIAADTAASPERNQQRGARIDALRRLPKAFGTARRPWPAP